MKLKVTKSMKKIFILCVTLAMIAPTIPFEPLTNVSALNEGETEYLDESTSVRDENTDSITNVENMTSNDSIQNDEEKENQQNEENKNTDVLDDIAVAPIKTQTVNINKDWTFKDGDTLKTIDLPHCWEYVHPTMSFIPTMNRKDVVYSKTMDISQYSGKNIFIKFYGVNKKMTLLINGEEVGTHIGGFTAFAFNITDYVKDGNIKIEVKNNNIDTESMPINTDFTHFAGIYRDVELVFTDEVYISKEDYGSKGIYVNQKKLEKNKAELEVITKLSSQVDTEQNRKIKVDILDKDGSIVQTTTNDVTVSADAVNQTFTSQLTIDNPHLWQGTIDPYLYTVRVSLIENDKTTEDIESRIGLRTFEVKNGKFYLNGSLYELHGVGMHQDREDYGNATTKEMKKEDLDNIKDLGANAIRTAHYPHDQYIYDLADEYGFVIWNEIPFYMIMADTTTFRNTTKDQLVEMIRQGYNHPSIICWGIQNEVNTNPAYSNYGKEFNVNSDTLAAFMTELAKLARKEDSSRLVVQAHIVDDDKFDESLKWTKNGIIDYTGFNLYFGFKSPINSADQTGYNTIVEQYNNKINRNAKKLNNSIAISEYGAGGNIEQHAVINGDFSWSGNDATEPSHPEEYQSFVHEAAYNAISNNKNVWVSFIWNMFDFSSYRTQGSKERLNNKGLMDYDHKTKKDVYYFYKANWNKNDKFTYITSKRETVKEINDDTIKVYSNCDNVELFINGKSLGLGKKQQSGVFVWNNIKYTATNDVKVVGDGQYEDSVTFTTNPVFVSYSSYLQDTEWQSTKYNGQTAGSIGQSKRMEAIKINLTKADNMNGTIEYQSHIQNIGWEKNWATQGEVSGTMHKSARLEAIRIRLTGEMAEKYDIYYRVHAQNFGWLDWAKNGENAGTAGYSYRLEAMQIKIVEKGATAPGKTATPYQQKAFLGYRTHVQNIGWQNFVNDKEVSGTEGQSLRTEAIQINLVNAPCTGSVQYRTHIQDVGWQDWGKDNYVAGTTGQSKRMEAIEIKLTGEMAEKYDIYYRAHCQNFGWLDWAKNGEAAGTEGYSYRMESIQIMLVEKGKAAPGKTNEHFYKK